MMKIISDEQLELLHDYGASVEEVAQAQLHADVKVELEWLIPIAEQTLPLWFSPLILRRITQLKSILEASE